MKLHEFSAEPEILERVTVRLLREDERQRFDQLLEQKHYLCSARLVGRTLRYVADLDGEWVALACFSAAALHLKAREQWIRWPPANAPGGSGWWSTTAGTLCCRSGSGCRTWPRGRWVYVCASFRVTGRRAGESRTAKRDARLHVLEHNKYE